MFPQALTLCRESRWLAVSDVKGWAYCPAFPNVYVFWSGKPEQCVSQDLTPQRNAHDEVIVCGLALSDSAATSGALAPQNCLGDAISGYGALRELPREMLEAISQLFHTVGTLPAVAHQGACVQRSVRVRLLGHGAALALKQRLTRIVAAGSQSEEVSLSGRLL